MKTRNKKSEVSDGGRTHVRFTRNEWKKIEEDKDESKRSIPYLLKSAYFSSGGMSILMNNVNAKSLIGHVGKIGNNVNQIAKRVNKGETALQEELAEITKHLGQILGYLGDYCGNRQN